MNLNSKTYPGNSPQAVSGIRLMRGVQPDPLKDAEIQHRQMDLFLTMKGINMIRQMFGGDAHVHGPERVNQKIDHFNAILRDIRDNKSVLDNLLPEQKEQFERYLRTLFNQFDNSVDQAVAGYGKGISSINKCDSRRRGEESIDLITQEVRRISEVLQKAKDIWNMINKALEDMRTTSQLLSLENQSIENQVIRVRNAYSELLIYSSKYRGKELLMMQKQIFEQSVYTLRWTLDRLEEKVKKDLMEMEQEVQRGTEDLAQITQSLKNIRTCRGYLSEFESRRLNQQLRKQVDAAERAYNEVFANSGNRQYQVQLQSRTQQLRDIADSLKQTQAKLEKGWIESISRQVRASINWFNANSYTSEGSNELALTAIKEKYKLLSDSIDNAEAIVIEYQGNLKITKIQEYKEIASALEDLERGFVKLAFPAKYREIHGLIEQMASLDITSYFEMPVKGIGPSDQITEVLKEAYTRLYDAARASILEAQRGVLDYAAITRAQQSVKRVEAAQREFKSIAHIVEQMQEALDTLSHLETQARMAGLSHQIIQRLKETYSTLYGEAQASTIKVVQTGASKEALSEAQAVVIKLQRHVHVLGNTVIDQQKKK
jgi:hypothetical protein